MAARRRDDPVPHHRVDARLYAKASKKADKEGTSMSQVGATGLAQIASSLSSREQREFLAAEKEGVLASNRSMQELPKRVSTTLQRMRTNRDPLLSPYLAALHQAGWSLGVLCEPLGVSRQAVHDRVKKVDPDAVATLPLPSVPKPAWRMAAPGEAPADGLRDWPVWVDRDVYSVVAQHARRQGTPMRLVMEGILRDYLEGKVIIE